VATIADGSQKYWQLFASQLIIDGGGDGGGNSGSSSDGGDESGRQRTAAKNIGNCLLCKLIIKRGDGGNDSGRQPKILAIICFAINYRRWWRRWRQ
jgi:hypothetical protein